MSTSMRRNASPTACAPKARPALAVGADVTDRSAVEQAFAKVRSELGPVTVLVTSAGMFGFSPFLDITAESWSRIIDVNLTGTFHCCQVALPDMVEANWGES